MKENYNPKSRHPGTDEEGYETLSITGSNQEVIAKRVSKYVLDGWGCWIMGNLGDQFGAHLYRMAEDNREVAPTHRARFDQWFCPSPNCSWAGHYDTTQAVMYKGVDWQCCPLCGTIVIPKDGSTEFLGYLTVSQ